MTSSRELVMQRFPDFEIQKSQALKENSEKQNTKKSASTWLNVGTSWAKNKNQFAHLRSETINRAEDIFHF